MHLQVKDVTGFTAARLFIGCSLCMFVCCQFWVGTMFNVRIVGTANAIAAGWGNMGGGACAFIMPLLYEVSSSSWMCSSQVYNKKETAAVSTSPHVQDPLPCGTHLRLWRSLHTLLLAGPTFLTVIYSPA